MFSDNKKIYMLFILCLLTASDFIAQTESDKSIGEKLVDDGLIFLYDGASYFTAPAKFSADDWALTGLTVTSTFLLFHLDEYIQEAVSRKDAHTLNDDIWDIPTSYGIVSYANIFSLATYGTGLLTGEDEVRKVGRMMFQSLSYSGIAVMALRMLFGRERPYSGKGAWEFTWFNLDNEVQSFPSGHTTVAFAFSTVLAEYFDTIWSRVLFYGMASLTGFARVYNNQHWFSDVIVGALLGLTSGFHVINEEYKRQNNSESKLSFIFGHNRIGIKYAIW
jgi:membrane-associated phospholipid phosphatase